MTTSTAPAFIGSRTRLYRQETICKKRLAAFYGRKALLLYQEGEIRLARSSLVRSLWYYPGMKGGPAEDFLPQVFFFVRVSRSIILAIKRVYQKLKK